MPTRTIRPVIKLPNGQEITPVTVLADGKVLIREVKLSD